MNQPQRHSAIEVEVANRQPQPIDEAALSAALAEVLADEGITAASISLAIVDDREMHQLNRRHLNHDWPTDVLSFVLDADEAGLAGEIIVSVETAAAVAVRYGWKMDDELLLYVIHGALHLAGFDDTTAAARREMRRREQHHLARYGLEPRYDEPSDRRPAGGRATIEGRQ